MRVLDLRKLTERDNLHNFDKVDYVVMAINASKKLQDVCDTYDKRKAKMQEITVDFQKYKENYIIIMRELGFSERFLGNIRIALERLSSHDSVFFKATNETLFEHYRSLINTRYKVLNIDDINTQGLDLTCFKNILN